MIEGGGRMSVNSVPSHSKDQRPAEHPVSLLHIEDESASGKEHEAVAARESIQDKNEKAEKVTRSFKYAPGRANDNAEILRFRESERLLHWAIAIPFILCWVTAFILVVVYNPDPSRPLREFFAVVHRIAALGLILLPGLVMLKNYRDYKIHLYNIRCAWLWSLNDLKWLSLMGLAAVSKKIVLPEQGKFNAAEKVNFMIVMVACPIFMITGIMIWMQELSWVAWLVHASLALVVTPTMLGHIYMATVNPTTRAGLKGMISGYVNRQWARHHYGLWYREFFEEKVQEAHTFSGMPHPPSHHVRIHCPSCKENMSVSWAWLIQKVFTVNPVFCPNCGDTFAAITTITDQQELEWIKHKMEKNAAASQATKTR